MLEMKLTSLYKLASLALVLIFTQEFGYCAEYEKIITCPAKIECLRDKSISSCSAKGENLEYWGKINSNAPLKKGTYYFHSVFATYQSPEESGFSVFPTCFYILNGSTQQLEIESIFLNAKPNSYMEAYLKPSAHQWILDGYGALCESDGDPQICPLTKMPLLNIKLDTKFVLLNVYANGILMNDYPIYPEITPYALTMYKAWDACTETGLCLLHLIIKEGAGTLEIGSILVDMSNKMKIQFIYPSSGTGYSIYSKPETPNLIEIKSTELST